MPSLQLNSNGKPIAKVEGGKYNGEVLSINEEMDSNASKKDIVVSMLNKVIEEEVTKNAVNNRMRQRIADMDLLKRAFERDKDSLKDPRLNSLYQQIKQKYFTKINTEFRVDDGTMRPVPNIDTRDIVYIAGPAGSGKSFFVRQYALAYNKLFPKNPVYLFSKVDDDPSLEGIQRLKKIKLDMDIVDEPIEPDELSNSLCIFDDVSTIRNKAIKDEILNLINDIAEIGRHDSVYMCITNHLLSDYKSTRTILNECKSLVCFPSAGSAHQIKYVLRTYFGLDNDDVNRVLKLNSRWAQIFKNFPQCILYQHGAYLLSKT